MMADGRCPMPMADGKERLDGHLISLIYFKVYLYAKKQKNTIAISALLLQIFANVIQKRAFSRNYLTAIYFSYLVQ